MSRQMVRLTKDSTGQQEAKRRKRLLAARREESAKGPLDKAFADLTGTEKDELLKRLAIMAGLVEE